MYRMEKRKEFEDSIRRQRFHLGTWMKYARWEAAQQEFDRARSVFERALDVTYKQESLWLKYAEMEMTNKFVNRARNVWDRAVTLLPRVDQFWYKYAYMEEMLENIEAARLVFERWMQWEPQESAWNSYIKFEERQNEVENARKIYERFLACHQLAKSYIKYAKWEERQMQRLLARRVFERALQELNAEDHSQELFMSFAKFEERCKEFDRARGIYKYALDHLPKYQADDCYKAFIEFEKQHGDRQGIEDVIIGKRRFQYEDQIKVDPLNYDVWFDYIRLEESNGTLEKVRDVYERAIAHPPPVVEKRFWRRYIYLWINYAMYEELTALDPTRTRAVYTACLRVIPHAAFTFSKIWLLFAHFEVREKDLTAARRILGTAIGMCPKESLFKGYIQLELQLANVDRCRKLYEKYLETLPHNCYAWSKFAELENSVGETDRCRAIFELAASQPLLDMPEVLWKTYIDFEITAGETARTRILFERLLDRTKHVKAWLSYAQFEVKHGGVDEARDVFARAYKHAKSEALTEERVMILEQWRDMEAAQPDNRARLKEVVEKLPRKIKKKRMLTAEDGSSAGWEEYFDYVFPDDVAAQPSLKILEMAHKWKLNKRKADDLEEEGGTVFAAPLPRTAVPPAVGAEESTASETNDADAPDE